MLERTAYPVVITYDEKEPTKYKYSAFVPDFELNTQGSTLAETIFMARDVIGLAGLSLLEDLGQTLPDPNSKSFESNEGDIVTFVDIDFEEYKRANDTTPVKKTLSIPKYLNDAGIAAGLNFSKTLSDAIREELHLV